MVAQFGAAIRGVHQIVAVGDAVCADQRQGNRRQAVVHRGGRQHRRDGHATVSGVEVQLVAVPTDLVPLGIALRPSVARRGDVLDHLRQGLLALAMNRRLLGGRTNIATPGTATFLRRSRGRLRCGGLALKRVFASNDGSAVAADVSDQFVPKMVLDQGFMHAFRQAGFGEFLEDTGEGGFRGQFPARRKTTDATQGAINRQPLDQTPRRAQPQYGFGDKRVGQPGPLMRRTAFSAPRRLHKLLDAHPLQRMDDLLQLRRQRTDVVAQFGQQFVLNHVPALHDQVASGSIHFAGFMMLALRTASYQKWPPAPSNFASCREKNSVQSMFCKRLICP